MSHLLEAMVRRMELPSETGAPWAVTGCLVSMEGYREFAWERYPAG